MKTEHITSWVMQLKEAEKGRLFLAENDADA